MEYILFCSNGIGDKLMDIIGIVTYCNIKNYNYLIVLNDIIGDCGFGMNNNYYDIELFNFETLNICNSYQDNNKNKTIILGEKFNNTSDKYKTKKFETDPSSYKLNELINIKKYNIIYYNPVITYNPYGIYDKLLNMKDNTLDNTLNNTLDNTLNNTLDNTLDNTLNNTLNNTLDNTLDNTLNNTLDNILDNTLNNTLDNTLNNKLNNINEIYKNIASNIKPSSKIESLIPYKIEKSYGIHLRRSNKIKDEESYKIKKDNNCHIWYNSISEYHNLIILIKNYIIEIINNEDNPLFFITSEDYLFKKDFEEWIKSNNGNIILIDNYESYTDKSFIAVLELFCLSRCKCIIQGIKYSSFSTVASLIGKNKKIINLSNDDDNLLNIFNKCISINNIDSSNIIDLDNIKNLYKNFNKINH
jgi:hypothetical protein